jgi:hypothetical protein
MQVISSALRMRGGGEDSEVVVLQHVEPLCEIGRVIVARLGRYAEIGREKRGPELGNQLLGSVTGIAPALAAEFTPWIVGRY